MRSVLTWLISRLLFILIPGLWLTPAPFLSNPIKVDEIFCFKLIISLGPLLVGVVGMKFLSNQTVSNIMDLNYMQLSNSESTYPVAIAI